jgi:hypothetical protein
MACNDTMGRVGADTQPDEDKISVFDTTLQIEARTIQVDSIYAKTINGLLGEYYDPSYGTMKGSYICQYYPSIGFFYLDSIVDNKIDSVQLNISYSFLGDSLAPMELTVYPVIKQLDKHYYTNTDPDDYCDLRNPITKYSYTARNLNISDSAMIASGYTYYISVPLPVEFGQEYLDKIRNNELKSVDEFLEFFPGTYITTTFGTGSMLAVNYTEILLYYSRKTTLKDINGNDSIAIRVSNAAFAVTKEIIQLNTFKNTNPSFLLENNPDSIYLKSPAGVFTELTIPIKEIVKGIGKKKFSSVVLSLSAYERNKWEYSLPFPGIGQMGSSYYKSKLLLIEPDSVKNFFEQQKIADNKTSFSTVFNSSTYTYNFNNIANVVQNAIEKAPDKDLKLWLIPVLTTWTPQSNGVSSVEVDYMTSHYLYPSGVTLKKGGDNLKVRVIATDLKIND